MTPQRAPSPALGYILLSEFDLIRRYFAHLGSRRRDVALGVGDDCALLRIPTGQALAISIDTLVAGVHFFADCDPQALGHKALAVGLSDLAAMGAEPAWATLALTLPPELARSAADARIGGPIDPDACAQTGAQPNWLAAFCGGFEALARRYSLALVGGDTTRGPLTISVQVHGLVPEGQAVRRAGAAAGDLVCVSGSLGDAGLALRRLLSGDPVGEGPRRRLERPEPRVALGLALRGLASAMIDVSDGLAADLGHILEASGVGAEILLDELPRSAEVAATGDWSLPLASGDDYELCFTLPAAHRPLLAELTARTGVALTVIGEIVRGPGLHCRRADGSELRLAHRGYDHFDG